MKSIRQMHYIDVKDRSLQLKEFQKNN